MAVQAASIMPLPSAEASTLSPDRLTTTRARGMPTVPPATSSASRWKPSTRSWPSSSATIASRSASVISTLRSASSLKRVNAWFNPSPWTWMPIFSSVLAKAWRPECLPRTIWRPTWPTLAASMIS